ncbi:unnamed protein product [Caenorhabditis auriculariae]|uniref:Uncharacterized protein n=1 Tax=Caenorhabditis auriculariae TaxID=2777116 RepID=A0A8S1H4Y1_9PELO|nr:unnamed protein product [Caenorhabditis auriculariae]
MCLGIPLSSWLPLAMEAFMAYSYIGILSQFALYVKDVHQFTPTATRLATHVYIAILTSIPLFIAYLADNVYGQFRVVVFTALGSVFGYSFLYLGSREDLPYYSTIPFFVIGAILAAITMGTERSVTSIFAAQQIPKENQDYRPRVFSIFYIFCNVGATTTFFLLQLWKRSFSCYGRPYCYTTLFASYLGSSAIGALIFFVGLPFLQSKSDSTTTMMNYSKTGSFLDYAFPDYSRRYIFELWSMIKAIRVCAVVAIPFFAIYFQVFSSLVIQGEYLNRRFRSYVIPVDQQNVVIPIICIVAAFSRKFIFGSSDGFFNHHRQMAIGSILCLIAVIITAVIQIQIDMVDSLEHDETMVTVITHPESLTEDCEIVFSEDFSESVRRGHHHSLKSKKCDFEFTFTPYSEGHVVIIDRITEKNFTNFYESSFGIHKPAGHVVMLAMALEQGKMAEASLSPTGANELKKVVFREDIVIEHALPITSEPNFTITYSNGAKLTIDSTYAGGGLYVIDPTDLSLIEIIPGNTISFIFQLSAFLLILSAETMIIVAGQEFCYSQSSASMKTIMQSSWLLFSFAGNLINFILSPVSFEVTYIIAIILAAVSTILFIGMTRNYNYNSIDTLSRSDSQTSAEKL